MPPLTLTLASNPPRPPQGGHHLTESVMSRDLIDAAVMVACIALTTLAFHLAT